MLTGCEIAAGPATMTRGEDLSMKV